MLTQPNSDSFLRRASGYVDFGGIRIQFGQPDTATHAPSEAKEVAIRDMSTADLKMVQDSLLGRLKEVNDELGRRGK